MSLNAFVTLVVFTLVVSHIAFTLYKGYKVGRQAADTASEVSALKGDVIKDSVSILIPAWNESAVLAATAEALDLELQESDPVTVIIIAGGNDDSFAAAERLAAKYGPKWQVLEQAPNGKNAALNQGLAVKESDIYILLDADTRVQPGWLQALTQPLRTGRAEAAAGRFRAVNRTPVSRVFELDQLVSQQLLGSVVLFGGGSVALSARALAAIGGRFDEDVRVGVDWHLSEQLKKRDLPFVFVQDAVVETYISATWPEYFRNDVRWRRAFFKNELKHYRADGGVSRLMGLVYTPLVQLLCLSGWLLYPLLAWLIGLGLAQGVVLWLLFLLWVLGRHAARCVMAFAYTRSSAWLKLIPTYILSFLVSAAAAIKALASLRRSLTHFKGSRPANV